MNIRAKLYCESLTKNMDGSERVSLRAVCDGSPENKTFSKFTPAAQLEMTISNPDARGAFVPGAQYYLDFKSADSTSA